MTSSDDIGVPNTIEDHRVPTPLAFAGGGLLVAVALPGGLEGGEGFLIGLGMGFLLSVLVAAIPVNSITLPALGEKHG